MHCHIARIEAWEAHVPELAGKGVGPASVLACTSTSILLSDSGQTGGMKAF